MATDSKQKIKLLEEPTNLVITRNNNAIPPKVNIIPISNWMVTTAYIEAEKNSLYVGGSYKPTFLNMQQVIAIGPRVEDVKVGDWVYIDMSKFIKTVKTKSTIRAGVGGADMITEQLVPPVFAGPDSDITYFKISDREIEGVIPDPYSMEKEYTTIEAFMERQENMQKEYTDAKKEHDITMNSGKLIQDISKKESYPMTITETSPKNR